MRSDIQVPLPKGWPNRIRSAVIHVISLAHFSLEVYNDDPAACLAPRFEPRPRWPRYSPCASPRAQVRGRCGIRLELRLGCVAGRKHLPIG